MPRRFPEPWTVHSSDSAFWIEDAAGKKFAFTYFEATPRNESYLYRDEARRIATNIAKLPKLLKGFK